MEQTICLSKCKTQEVHGEEGWVQALHAIRKETTGGVPSAVRVAGTQKHKHPITPTPHHCTAQRWPRTDVSAGGEQGKYGVDTFTPLMPRLVTAYTPFHWSRSTSTLRYCRQPGVRPVSDVEAGQAMDAEGLHLITHIHTYAHTHTRTHTHTYAHARTHTHTHATRAGARLALKSLSSSLGQSIAYPAQMGLPNHAIVGGGGRSLSRKCITQWQRLVCISHKRSLATAGATTTTGSALGCSTSDHEGHAPYELGSKHGPHSCRAG